MVSRRLAIAGAAAACAACCAPLVVPLVWPALLAAGVVGAGGGWLAGLSPDVILCGAVTLVALAGDEPPFAGAYPDDEYARVSTKVQAVDSWVFEPALVETESGIADLQFGYQSDQAIVRLVE